MSRTVLYMSMSLDGFVAGPNESVDNGLGDGGVRLHEWLRLDDRDEGGLPGRPAGVNGEVWHRFMATGAVATGSGTFAMAGGWSTDHHDGVPILVLTRDPEAHRAHAGPRTTFHHDVVELMARARDAAGARDVLVHGVGLARLALAAGVLDEVHVSVVPVVLGAGRPLFEDLPGPVELERLEVRAGEQGVTHLRHRVVR
jgi:dihydrofolate reductase